MINTIVSILIDSSILIASVMFIIFYLFIRSVFRVFVKVVWKAFILLVVRFVSVVSGFRLLFELGFIFDISCFSRISSFSSLSSLNAISTHSRTDRLACLLAITRFSSYSLYAKVAIFICLLYSSIAYSIISNAMSIIFINQK